MKLQLLVSLSSINSSFQTLQCEVHNKQPELQSVLDDSSSVIHQASLVCNVGDIQQDLDAVQTSWPALLDDIENQTTRLTDIGLISNTYQTQLATTLAWLATPLMADKLSWLQPLDEARDEQGRVAASSATRLLQDMRSLMSDVEQQAVEREALTRTAQVLIERCAVDQTGVRQQLDEIDATWTQLNFRY